MPFSILCLLKPGGGCGTAVEPTTHDVKVKGSNSVGLLVLSLFPCYVSIVEVLL